MAEVKSLKGDVLDVPERLLVLLGVAVFEEWIPPAGQILHPCRPATFQRTGTSTSWALRSSTDCAGQMTSSAADQEKLPGSNCSRLGTHRRGSSLTKTSSNCAERFLVFIAGSLVELPVVVAWRAPGTFYPQIGSLAFEAAYRIGSYDDRVIGFPGSPEFRGTSASRYTPARMMTRSPAQATSQALVIVLKRFTRAGSCLRRSAHADPRHSPLRGPK